MFKKSIQMCFGLRLELILWVRVRIYLDKYPLAGSRYIPSRKIQSWLIPPRSRMQEFLFVDENHDANTNPKSFFLVELTGVEYTDHPVGQMSVGKMSGSRVYI